jgi:hypothetical protein
LRDALEFSHSAITEWSTRGREDGPYSIGMHGSIQAAARKFSSLKLVEVPLSNQQKRHQSFYIFLFIWKNI